MSVQMLQQRSAHGHVDHLLAAADPHHRQAAVSSLREEPQLRVIELPVDRPNLGIGFFSIEGGIDVPPARQQEAVKLGQRPRAGRQLHRVGPHRLDRALIGEVVAVPTPGAGGDTDPGAGFFRHRNATRLRSAVRVLSRTFLNRVNLDEMKCP